MAVVDFTLEDVQRVVVEDVRNIVIDMRNVIIENVGKIIDARFQTFEIKYDDDMRAIQDDLTIIISRLDAVEKNAVITRRIVDKHSKDIMQLRAVVEQ